MSYQVLARKWRPKRFSELVGQEHVVRALTNALDSGRIHHAFLFTGTRGVGKTTIARIFAKSLNCERGASSEPCGECSACADIDAGRFIDLLEIDAASRTKVDDTRELLDNVIYAPTRGRCKVYLIDEVHMLSGHSFNALLKTLEEPPPHVKFLLATTDPQKLPVTVLSRCLKFNLKRLVPDQITGQMQRILDAEEIVYDADALSELARGADGSLRDGLSLLDQAIAYGAGAVRGDEVRAMLGTIERGRVFALLHAVHAGSGVQLMTEIDRIAEFSPDFAAVLDEVAAALHRVQLKQLVADYVSVDATDLAGVEALAAAFAPEDSQLYYQIAITGRRDLALAPTARAGFEMVLLRMLAFRPAGNSQTIQAPASTTSPVPSAKPARAAVVLAAAEAAATGSEHMSETLRERPKPAPMSALAERSRQSPTVESIVPRDGEPVATPAPTASPATTAAEEKTTSLDLKDWPALIEAAGLKGPAGQLAQHAVLLGIDEHVVRLALKPLHEHFNAPSMVTAIEQKLSLLLARNLKVRFEKIAIGETPEAPFETAGRERSARQVATEQAMRADPFVQALVNDFDGRIVPDSIKGI